MESFKNQDEAYVEWVEHHDQGYVLNVGTGGTNRAMLHTARCWHFYPFDSESPTKSYTKVCANGKDELYAWAHDNDVAVRECAGCKP